MIGVETILSFWFEEIDRSKWFAKDTAFDDVIRSRFEGSYRDAVSGAFDSWCDSGKGCVAMCIVLDQFPRNMYRDRPEAYASDEQALAVTRDALARGRDLEYGIGSDFRHFLYMPLMHSERLADQRQCVELIRTRLSDAKVLQYAEQHLSVIERFGRFPHRNAILGRNSTPEERDFLKSPDAYF